MASAGGSGSGTAGACCSEDTADPPNNQEDQEGGDIATVAQISEEDLLSSDKISVIYFTVGGDNHHDTALVPIDAPPDDIKGTLTIQLSLPKSWLLMQLYILNTYRLFLLFCADMFRAAVEAGPCDIVKLYTPDGRLINISPTIPPNTPSTPYRLEVMAVHCNGKTDKGNKTKRNGM